MANKLYIANLGDQVTEAQIYALFSQAGEIVSVELAMTADAGQSRGYGFIQMSTAEGATEAIRLFNHQTMGDRKMIVTEAIRQTG